MAVILMLEYFWRYITRRAILGFMLKLRHDLDVN